MKVAKGQTGVKRVRELIIERVGAWHTFDVAGRLLVCGPALLATTTAVHVIQHYEVL
jgi:hypothetical protein